MLSMSKQEVLKLVACLFSSPVIFERNDLLTVCCMRTDYLKQRQLANFDSIKKGFAHKFSLLLCNDRCSYILSVFY